MLTPCPANTIPYQPSSVYFDTEDTIDEYNYAKLVCTAAPGTNELLCTAYGTGRFCTDTEDEGSFFLADTCQNLVVLTVTIVDP